MGDKTKLKYKKTHKNNTKDIQQKKEPTKKQSRQNNMKHNKTNK